MFGFLRLVLFGCVIPLSLLVSCGPDRSVSRGADLFAENCAVCHGRDGRGGGGASVPGLGKTPSDLTVLSRQNDGVFPTRRVAAMISAYAQGEQIARRMRPFEALSSDRMKRMRTEDGRLRAPKPSADLIAYLVSIQRE